MDFTSAILNFITPAHIIYLVYALNTIIALGLIFIDRKTPSATLAWIMVMFLLPYVGLILYLILSQNIARRKIYKISKETEDTGSFLLNEQKNTIKDTIVKSKNRILHKWREMVIMNIDYSNSLLTMNSDIDLICDGNEMFDKLCEDIRNAKHTIKLQFFIVKDDFVGNKLIDLLTDKAKEGVKVRLLLDAMGSRSIGEIDLLKFKNAGGEYAFFFKPRLRHLFINFNYRNHRKIAIIDNEIGYIGGFNIAREYLGQKKKFGYWRDTQIVIRGNALFSLNEQFYLDWLSANKDDETFNFIEHSFKYSYNEDGGNIPIQIVSCGPESEKEEIKLGFMKMINGARKNINIQTPYLVPDEPVLESLCMAARSGVDVKIMIPCMPDHPFVYRTTLYNAGRLIREGAKVFIYNNGFLHSKTLTVDGEISTVGSANFDIRSFKLNFESNAFVYDEKFTHKIDSYFKKDLKYCKEYTQEDRENIGVKEKMLESISRLLQEIM